MQKGIIKNVKPLSKNMEEQLMEIHERELLAMEPVCIHLNRSASALQKRGFVGLRQAIINNKSFYTYCITPLGILYLSINK